MGDKPRKVEDEMTQEEQYGQLTETNNGPTLLTEDTMVEDVFGTQELGEQ